MDNPPKKFVFHLCERIFLAQKSFDLEKCPICHSQLQPYFLLGKSSQIFLSCARNGCFVSGCVYYKSASGVLLPLPESQNEFLCRLMALAYSNAFISMESVGTKGRVSLGNWEMEKVPICTQITKLKKLDLLSILYREFCYAFASQSLSFERFSQLSYYPLHK